MSLTADDLWPLVAKLPRPERMRLAQLALAGALPTGARDASAYDEVPVRADEFGASDDDPLAWDAEGWDEVG